LGEVKLSIIPHCPAREDVGEGQNIVLGVLAHPQGVKLEDLPREVLVEAALAARSGQGLGAGGADIVEIDEHRRVACGADQQLSERAVHAGADDLTLEGADQPQALLAGGRDGEHVAEEADQAL